MSLLREATRPTLQFLTWIVTRHLLPYGLVASGARVASVNHESYARLGFELYYGRCKSCGTDIVSRRRLNTCRSFSCFKKTA